MSSRMLIDARHPEETRVAVVKGNRVEEFDFEAAARKQLKGNIYLAKVTRVEPSLQAAFIEYGGNRHGFLAFSEIHPDYYQIPKEDREALLREEQEAARALAEEHHADDEAEAAPADDDADHDDGDAQEDAPPPPADEHHGDHDHTTESLRKKRMNLRRRYQIQEVIHRRQVMLVQVVKEERGNKGAALTTYLSLAGRYCVLMPNTHNGGGISRKISNQSDRKRLKSIMADLVLPAGMACIVRTAGLQRTRAEIKRDFDYLCRLWDGIRETTLAASAPALIHADSDLLKRAIRDVYSREIEQILVEGEAGFESAHAFMKQLMPTHAKKVQRYSDAVPLFQRFGVEGQLAAMFNPVVQLKSGGYLVINPTEALVAIDINSGRSTREHNIEDTALRTNLEAADEIARQLRLRDMAGLVVIDFIDMEVNGNVRKVEKAMKEALKNDRARIQIGRISSFGLMEMSRQRLRTGILEASSHTCPMCDGAGSVRTPSSAALGALRGLEEEALRGKNSVFRLRAANEVAVYILNRKRGEVADLEARYGITIEIFPDISLMSPRVEIDASGGPSAKALPSLNPLPVPEKVEDDADTEETLDAGEDDGDETPRARDGARDGDRDDGRRKRRRRRRGGRGDRDDAPAAEGGEAAEAGEGDDTAAQDREDGGADDKARGDRKRRRRGRRGGRGRSAGDAPETPVEAEAETAPEPEAAPAVVEDAAAKPARKSRAKKPKADAEAAAEVVTEAVAEPVEAPVVEEAPKKPARKPRAKKAAAQDAAPAETVAAPEAANDPEAEPQPRRKGWWQRTFGE